MGRSLALLVLPFALLSCASLPAPLVPAGPVDHHMHIRSAAAAELTLAACRRQPSICPPDLDLTAGELGGAVAVAHLDEAGLGQGVLLSMAYSFSTPQLGYEGDITSAIRAENAFTIAEARRHPGRLVPFISVNPLRPDSEAEIRYWAPRGARGIKLHVGAAGLDLRDEDHVSQLERIFALAGELRLPLIVHLRPQPPRQYGPQDARLFIERLLPAARGVPVQIAHFGGGGGYDSESFGVMDTFAKAVESGEPGLENLLFDLSGILHPQLPDQVYDLIVTLSRRLGVQRIVMGSDWWGAESPAVYYAQARDKYPFTGEEWAYIVANRAPYMR